MTSIKTRRPIWDRFLRDDKIILTQKVDILRLDTPALNTYIYSKEAVQKAIEAINFQAPGQIGMPEWDMLAKVDLKKISHCVVLMKIEGKKLVGYVKVFPTDEGRTLKLLMQSNKIEFKTAGLGIISDKHVVTNFSLVSVNAVMNDGRDSKEPSIMIDNSIA